MCPAMMPNSAVAMEGRVLTMPSGSQVLVPRIIVPAEHDPIDVMREVAFHIQAPGP